MQENDHPADRIYGRRDQRKGWKVQILRKAYSRNLGINTPYSSRLHYCFNIFMNLTFQPDGSIKLQEPLSKPGGYLDLKGEMDCIVALSKRPQDRNPCNGFNPTPLQIKVFSSAS